MKSRLNNVSLEFHGNVLKNIVKRRFSTSKFFLPLTTTFFITMRCNLKCSYCQPILPETKELPTEKVLDLIEKVRYKCPGLYISGGEPLLRNDMPVILKRARELKFKPLWLITNALNLDRRLDCLQYLDYLAVSLDSLNINKWEKILGVDGVAKKIIDNIIMASKLQKKYGFIMAINNVISEDTIEDFPELLDFCNEHNIHIAPQPIDDFTKLNDNLVNSPEYIRLLENIKKLKSKGERHIIVTNAYLNTVLKMRSHTCYPTVNPKLYPDGSLLYPCTPFRRVYGNLFDYPNLYSMLREAYSKEKLPDCVRNTKKCMINCLVEPAILIDNPIRFGKDILDIIKQR